MKTYRTSVSIKRTTGLGSTLAMCATESGFLVHPGIDSVHMLIDQKPKPLSDAMDVTNRLCRTLTNCGFEVIEVTLRDGAL